MLVFGGVYGQYERKVRLKRMNSSRMTLQALGLGALGSKLINYDELGQRIVGAHFIVCT